MHPNGEAMPITDPALSVQGRDIPVVHQFEAKCSGTPVRLGDYALDNLRLIGLFVAK